MGGGTVTGAITQSPKALYYITLTEFREWICLRFRERNPEESVYEENFG